ncbi:acetyl-CoA carboxylase biotin carboxyl carrier protein [Diplocloster agilis]|uniref:acetyl-CoA carboxylase biotin carboxyl carrier protein n=1 Tax=Diplocloster agilis TaxID=2850323 RepID=UPI000820D3D0|nr:MULTISPECIES: acetyl-CoA carboxylase biotin carboxyl carrier protein [Lachnospiraceae]MBU9746479.1 acetyl-CoA carboxylase biotin carboxyl carrier protein [Diplocloster agilis]MCU6736954.1 acetyl-CoA carboxylase biotin carboxyl carrier protein [Suonthocola fibrivorans]SCJ94692.1 Biotin carboxyl carrier protein of acetyl-CoA carboxylase [uncultured Clostridium sp.]
MELENIIKLIHTVSESALSSFTLEEGDMKISLEARRDNQTVNISEGNPQISAAVSVIPSAASTPEPEIAAGNLIKSPLVGTFYNAPSPDAKAFVQAGDTVKKGQVLGIVEAMKLMNEIESEFDGIVEEVLIGNEQMVEYGQPLFRIR